MPKHVRIRRGTAAQHTTFTGAEGEVTYDTTNKRLVTHDGVTAGGKPVDGWVKKTTGARLVAQVIGDLCRGVAIHRRGSTDIAVDKVRLLQLWSYGTTENDILARWLVQP